MTVGAYLVRALDLDIHLAVDEATAARLIAEERFVVPPAGIEALAAIERIFPGSRAVAARRLNLKR